MITTKSNNKFTVVSVEKYEDYQSNRNENQQQNNNKVTTEEQQNNTNKNVKNDKNEKIYNIPASEVETSPADTAKANEKDAMPKHKYGEYKHVLLKDEELQKLKEKYTNWEELIRYLDEYIEMKGYKAKSHYLAIKNWVVDAVKKKQNKTKVKNMSNYVQRERNDLNNFYSN